MNNKLKSKLSYILLAQDFTVVPEIELNDSQVVYCKKLPELDIKVNTLVGQIKVVSQTSQTRNQFLFLIHFLMYFGHEVINNIKINNKSVKISDLDEFNYDIFCFHAKNFIEAPENIKKNIVIKFDLNFNALTEQSEKSLMSLLKHKLIFLKVEGSVYELYMINAPSNLNPHLPE